MFTAAAKAAIITGPKLLTSPCTIRIPKFMKMCIRDSNSTVLITKKETHPQTTAPGYAMWYLWVIRHLENDPYRCV